MYELCPKQDTKLLRKELTQMVDNGKLEILRRQLRYFESIGADEEIKKVKSDIIKYSTPSK